MIERKSVKIARSVYKTFFLKIPVIIRGSDIVACIFAIYITAGSLRPRLGSCGENKLVRSKQQITLGDLIHNTDVCYAELFS